MITEIIMNPLLEVAEVSVGQHYYWQIGNYEVHGQVLITSWIVLGIIIILSFLGNSNLKSTPDGFQNLTELVTASTLRMCLIIKQPYLVGALPSYGNMDNSYLINFKT